MLPFCRRSIRVRCVIVRSQSGGLVGVAPCRRLDPTISRTPLGTSFRSLRRHPSGRSVRRSRRACWPAKTSRICRYGIPQGHPVWLNRDPIFERGGVNIYMFVRNAPVSLMDYFGLKDWTCEETEGLLGEMRTQSPFEAFLNHTGDGKYDFKSKGPGDTFVVDRRTMPADAFGNYAAGYGGAARGGISRIPWSPGWGSLLRFLRPRKAQPSE